MATQVGVLAVKLNGDITDLQSKWTQAEQTLTRFSKGANKLGKSISRMGRSLSLKVTAPIAAGLGFGVKAMADFDSAMTKSLAIMGGVAPEMRKQMEAVATTMSEQTTFAASELAEAYFYLASAGLDAQQSMQALPSVAKFAQAGMFNLSQATDLLTDAQSALGMTTKNAAENMANMTKISDVLVKANTLANATVQQFSEALTNDAAAAMRAFGVDLETGVAVLAAYADQGEKGVSAGSAFGRVLRLLTKGARDNAEEFNRLGISVFDGQGNLRNMGVIIGELTRALDGMSTAEKGATLEALGFQSRMQQVILPLLGTSEKIGEYEAALRSAAGVTNEVAGEQMKSFASQIKVLRNEVTNLARSFGEALVPTLQKVIAWVRQAVQRFAGLSDSQKQNIVRVALWVAAIGPALIVVGTMIKMLASLAMGIKAVGAALTFLAANPIGAVIAAIGLAIIAVYKLIQAYRELRGRSQAPSAPGPSQFGKMTGTGAVYAGLSYTPVQSNEAIISKIKFRKADGDKAQKDTRNIKDNTSRMVELQEEQISLLQRTSSKTNIKEVNIL